MKTVALLLVLVLAGTVRVTADEGTVAEAIAEAVARKLGPGAEVTVTSITTDVADAAGLEATPDPAARLGQPSRFVLTSGGVRRGLATATVTAVAHYPRAARAIARDEVIGEDAVSSTRGEVPSMPLRPLPAIADLIGTKARRDIVTGEPLTAGLVWVAPLVKSGDPIAVLVRVGRVEVTSAGIASGSGGIGDTIRVLQPRNRRVLRARITGKGLAEVIP